MAWRSGAIPGPGGYWLAPSRMAAIAASDTSRGPSVSGKPCPRLMAPVSAARADISAKIVVPRPCRRLARNGARVIARDDASRHPLGSTDGPEGRRHHPRAPGRVGSSIAARSATATQQIWALLLQIVRTVFPPHAVYLFTDLV